MDLTPSFFAPHCLPSQYFVSTYYANQPAYTCKPKGPNFDYLPPVWQESYKSTHILPFNIELLWSIQHAGHAMTPDEKATYLAARKSNSPREIWLSPTPDSTHLEKKTVCSDADEEIVLSREPYIVFTGPCDECATVALLSEEVEAINRRSIERLVAQRKFCFDFWGKPTMLDLCHDAEVEFITTSRPFYGGLLPEEGCVFLGPLEEGPEGARRRLEKLRGVRVMKNEWER